MRLQRFFVLENSIADILGDLPRGVVIALRRFFLPFRLRAIVNLVFIPLLIAFTLGDSLALASQPLSVTTDLYELESYLNLPEVNADSMTVEVEVFVNYWDPNWGLLWMRDNDYQGFFNCSKLFTELLAGKWYLLEGVVQHEYGLESSSLHFTELTGKPPPPVIDFEKSESTTAGMLTPGNIRFEGIVDGVEVVDQNHVLYYLCTEKSRINCRVYRKNGGLPKFQTGVIIRGVGYLAPGSDLSPSSSQIWAASPESIEAIDFEDSRYSDIPDTKLFDLKTEEPGKQVRFRADLIQHVRGKSFLVSQNGNRMVLPTKQQEHPFLDQSYWFVTSVEENNGNTEILGAIMVADHLNQENEGPDTIRMTSDIWASINLNDRKDQEWNLYVIWRVLYYDPFWDLLWVFDGDRAGFIPIKSGKYDFSAGDYIRVVGSLIPQDGLEKHKIRIETIDTETQIPYVEISASEFTGSEVVFTRTKAFVLSQSKQDENHLIFDCSWNGIPLTVRVLLERGEKLPDFQFRWVDFTGTLVSNNDQQAGFSLWCSNLSSLQMKELENRAMDTSSVIPIAQLEELKAGDFFQINGEVQAISETGRMLVIDQSGSIEIGMMENYPVSIGNYLAIWGVFGASGTNSAFHDVVYRVLDKEETHHLQNRSSDWMLRTTEQVMKLDPEDVRMGREVQLSGYLTYIDPKEPFLYLNDSSGGLKVSFDVLLFPEIEVLEQGDAVKIIGKTRLDGFSPSVLAASIKPLGSRRIPIAKKVALQQALTGISDAQWIEMKGFVRRIDGSPNGGMLELENSQGRFSCESASGFNRGIELNSYVAIQGVCQVEYDSIRRLRGVKLLIQSPEQIKTLIEAPVELGDVQETTIDALEQYSRIELSDQFLRLELYNLYQKSGKYLIATDGKRSIRILSSYDQPIEFGQKITVAGIPSRTGTQSIIKAFILEPNNDVFVPDIIDRTEIDPLLPVTYGRYMFAEGKLLNVFRSNREVRLTLQAPQGLVNVLWNSGSGDSIFPEFGIDSILRITGINQITFDDYGNPVDSALLITGPEGVTMLKPPPWLNVRKVIVLLVILILILCLVFVWSQVLRKRIRANLAEIDKQKTLEIERQAAFLRIVDVSTDFIFTMDEEGNFITCNAASKAVTGYSVEELKSIKMYDILKPQHARLAKRIGRNLHGRDASDIYQLELQRKDGVWIWIETSASVLEDDDGRRFLSVVRDITARKKTYEELQKAKLLAEASAKEKASFLATMSHEIRTPLNGVIGFTTMLQETQLDEVQTDYSNEIWQSANSLLHLLTDILNYSKHESGDMSIISEDFELRGLIKSIESIFELPCRNKKQHFTKTISESVPRVVRSDPGRIRQILLNLVGNAVKFTPDGGKIKLKIGKEQSDDTSTRLLFEVFDSGIGLSKASVRKIFQPFVQVDISDSRKQEGVGLGLAITKQLVELLGGEIGVESELRAGSKFWVKIPVEVVIEEAVQDTAVVEAEEELHEKVETLRVLLAEDNKVNQKVALLLLKQLGVNADVAKNGKEVLQAFLSKEYDVVFMDCKMPEMDGFEATTKIRKTKLNKQPRIIALTANAFPEDKEKCISCGMDAYLSKPVTKTNFVEQLNLTLAT